MRPGVVSVLGLRTPFCDPCRDRAPLGRARSGGVASLNHRLRSRFPPGTRRHKPIPPGRPSGVVHPQPVFSGNLEELHTQTRHQAGHLTLANGQTDLNPGLLQPRDCTVPTRVPHRPPHRAPSLAGRSLWRSFRPLSRPSKSAPASAENRPPTGAKQLPPIPAAHSAPPRVSRRIL